MIQYLYYLFQTAFNFVLPANFYLAVHFLVIYGFRENEWSFYNTEAIDESLRDASTIVFNAIYGVLMFTQITIWLGNNDRRRWFLPP